MAQQKETEYNRGPVPLDESWWTAVLEDVEVNYLAKPRLLDGKSIQADQPSTENTKQIRDEASITNDQEPSKEINWSLLKQLYEKDLVVDLEVSDLNRGGLLVCGETVQGFVPASHLVGLSKNTLKKSREELLSPYIGRSLRLKVIECDQDRGRIVFSERAAQTDPGKRLELLKRLSIGDQRIGRVTTITDFGVFVDLGGVEGLIHISELSWGRVCHPNEIVNIGEEIEVHVLQVDRDKGRVALSLKRLNPNPWESVHTRYTPGQIVNAVITNIVSFGVFARLEDGLDGLIHISEFGDRVAMQEIESIVSEGQTIKVKILHIDPDRQRLGLSFHKDEDGLL